MDDAAATADGENVGQHGTVQQERGPMVFGGAASDLLVHRQPRLRVVGQSAAGLGRGQAVPVFDECHAAERVHFHLEDNVPVIHGHRLDLHSVVSDFVVPELAGCRQRVGETFEHQNLRQNLFHTGQLD